MMLRCLQSLEELTGKNGTDMTLLERQRMRLIWLQQQQQGQQQNPLMQNYPIELNQTPQFSFLNKNDFGNFPITRSDEMGISSSEIVVEEKRVDSSFTAKTKKRKAEFCETEDYKDERIKEDIEEVESKETEKSIKESSTGTFKENSSKASEVQKPDYIHVRARRGQATDSHSLAERARREKISKKMKYLQDLVPGCNKITGKAGMLDEIINYVQSLQRQVEFLSMKLGALSPRLDFNTDNLFAKEFPAYVANFPSEMGNLASLQLNGLQQEASPSCLLDMSVNPQEIAAAQINRSPSLSIPEMYHETSCNSQVQIHPFSAWDTELQSLYNLEFH